MPTLVPRAYSDLDMFNTTSCFLFVSEKDFGWRVGLHLVATYSIVKLDMVL